MKLGVGLCVFSGAELLKPVLLNVRSFAHYVVAVMSTCSNEGHLAPAYLTPLLEQLLKEKLIDEIIDHTKVTPNEPWQAKATIISKREIGRVVCLNHGCTHYMGRDCDEFYGLGAFAAVLSEAEKYDLLIARTQEYVGSPLVRYKALSGLYVPVVGNINCEFVAKDFGVLCDTERTVDAKTFMVLPEQVLIMHHMNTVRYNRTELLRKFQGHSHFMRLGKQVEEGYVCNIDTINRDETCTAVDDFGILDYWQGEFKELYERTMQ